MQILCKASQLASDVRCHICGQGFLVYWTRSAPDEREYRRDQIVRALRDHHCSIESADAHPEAAFHLPDCESGAGLPGARTRRDSSAWAAA